MIKKGGGLCSGGRGGGGFNLLCVLPWVRLLLLVVCGLGRVDGFDKLPDGDGRNTDGGNENTLRRAVSDWIAGGVSSQSTVVLKYGTIEEWDVSEVTNMRYVASTFGSFNADLSKWNTGAVITMHRSKYIISLPLCGRASRVVFFSKVSSEHINSHTF